MSSKTRPIINSFITDKKTPRMNLGKGSACTELSILVIFHKPLTALKGLCSSKKGPIVPTRSMINPFKTDKTEARMDLGRGGVRNTLNLRHSP